MLLLTVMKDYYVTIETIVKDYGLEVKGEVSQDFLPLFFIN